MSGFGEYFKNEKRKSTISFFSNIFGSIFSKKAWFFIAFWIFLVATFGAFYKTITFENKFPVECGKIVNMEIVEGENSNMTDYHIFIQVTSTHIEDLEVKKNVYTKYEKLFETNKNLSYCESYTDKMFIFFCFVTGILIIITLVFLISYANEY
jgi:hypothetical protein